MSRSPFVSHFVGSFFSDGAVNTRLRTQTIRVEGPISAARLEVPVEGMLYYRTATSTYRRFRNGAWEDAGGDGGGAGTLAGQIAPVIENVNTSVNARVTFMDPSGLIDPGWQIEIYKYSPHRRGNHQYPGYPIREGKRYRPDRMLAVGATHWDVPVMLQRLRYRNHYRFGYRWPAPPGTLSPAPGLRGPISLLTVSTARLEDRNTDGTYLLLETPW